MDAKVVAPGGGRRRQRPRSLLLLLKSLVGLRVRVELKNDAAVEGLVQEVVNDMECVRDFFSFEMSKCQNVGSGEVLMGALELQLHGAGRG